MAAYRSMLNISNKLRLLSITPTYDSSSIASKLSPCIIDKLNIDKQVSSLHTSAALSRSRIPNVIPNEPKIWPKYNDIVYSPRQPGEPKRPAEITHFKANVKYSPKKLWYLACLVRGLSIDEAIKQMSFQEKKGSQFIRETLLEAQEMAVNEHNVEYKSNLFVADSFVGKGRIIKGYRKHAGVRYGVIHYRYTHYLVRLREGKPPKHYYAPEDSGHKKMTDYIDGLRNRTIINSL